MPVPVEGDAGQEGQDVCFENSDTEDFEDYGILDEYREVPDPLESWNRLIFRFNDKFYLWFFKPLANGYNAVVPEGGRTAVKNLFHNLKMPVRFLNAVLQFKIRRAGIELARFGINTTVGLAGLYDVAGKYESLKKNDEDLGQTMGHYGIGSGFYIVWPFLGPYTLRDSVGLAGDLYVDPLRYIRDKKLVLGLGSFRYFNENSLRIDDYENMKESAVDPYIAFRDAYYQYRQDQIER